MRIETIPRPVYRSLATGRCFLTIRAAASAEAAAALNKKYPPEKSEYDFETHYFDPGYHWRNDERLVRVHKRLMRLILRAFRAPAKRTP